MLSLRAVAVLLFAVLVINAAAAPASRDADPCAVIAGKKWVSPQEVRDCFTSFPVDPEIKDNIVEVVNKTLAFHTSVNYQRQAPPPFSLDVHEDVLGDLARISSQEYATDFDLHLDISRTLKRLNDGHCVYINLCYDSLYLTFLPTPLVLLSDVEGFQDVYIAPEAWTVASTEFADQIDVWQDALPTGLKGQLSSLSAAKVLLINGLDPFIAIDDNAHVTGSYQGFGTRQNSFFSSYGRSASGWNYMMGNFAQLSLPLADSATLTIQRHDSSAVENITLPYRSRISSSAVNWTDSISFRQNNCIAVEDTNGVDIYTTKQDSSFLTPGTPSQQQPFSLKRTPKHLMNELLDVARHQNVELPAERVPASPLNGSSGVAQFFMLDDNMTGILMLGSFAESFFDDLQESLLIGLQNLQSKGATQLIVDVTNNGGGYICIAHWLHRIIAGPSPSTVPQAGLATEARAGPLAQLVVKEIAKGADPENLLLYNPLSWEFANHTPFPAHYDWLQPPVEFMINGEHDVFSQRLGDECQPFELDPPKEALFDPKKVAIVSNGRCASSCSLFSITMTKLESAKTVVVGGKTDVRQQYCGIVGGQSTRFADIDTEIKTARLKNHSLAPPDFKTNSIQGITWRLGFGIDDPSQPEEWQDHPADVNFPLTPETVNNPVEIWKQVAKTVL
ncbi:hypothetical protein SCP_0510160 [Sparassis crispa]|uniref:Uncharacterized protein n=1 Tax=Sparassis crispa TaxID=139825 RepID=A0A401GP10_9APHY|nr:hypothetical protein SCP_0510160 [Sparassis crispa]GBE83957.1 hypothetical protein SCP_0510160 [Sparassis crispa]